MIARAQVGKQSIAIVGSGITGLISAWLLNESHDITVFEADERIGGHTHTVDVTLDGERHAIDTGFIVYNERNYPKFTKLLGILEVETQPSTMSFSVRCDRTGIEYNGTSLNRLFAQRRNLFRPSFHRMIRDILRFNKDAPAHLEARDETTTVAEFVEEGGYGEEFRNRYLLPMGAAVWSCPVGTFGDFPARFVFEFMQNHALFDLRGRPEWRVIQGGSHRYVEKLTAPFIDRIRTGTPVAGVRRTENGVTLRTADGMSRSFDHVIFACHSDQALRILEDPSAAEREILSSFPYEPNEAVLHTDASVMPRKRLAWGSWNYHVREEAPEASTVTYNMNILQGLRSRNVFLLTLNDTDGIDPDRILRRMTYHHPVFTAGRSAAQARHRELIGTRNTSYCGAYWGYGFHEDGVRSAIDACEHLGGSF